MKLTTVDHSRDVAGMTYVYPVVSRRAGGVSVGINLNPNNACNWRCAYCQVPNLTRGSAPEIDLPRLERELGDMLGALVEGDYMERHVPEGARRINDVALSGNGEPTTSHQFDAVIEIVGRALARRGLAGTVKVVVISNGSMTHRPKVQRGLDRLGTLDGEVWFKLDSATEAGRRQLNDTTADMAKVRDALVRVGARCRLRIQTMAVAVDGEEPAESERAAYLDFLRSALEAGAKIHDVLLYGLARASHQPEAARLSKLPLEWLESHADRIRALGLDVQVHA